MWKKITFLALLTVISLSCRTVVQPTSQKPSLSKVLQHAIDTSTILRQAHLGLGIVEGKDTLYNFQSNHYFIPASTTKLFTWYAGVVNLPDTLPAAYFKWKEDSLFLWGTGDPTTLHPEFGNDGLLRWLNQQNPKTLVYSEAHFKQRGLGPGWAWDDFDAPYSPEQSPLPLFGNVVWFKHQDNTLTVTPSFFQSMVTGQGTGSWIRRSWHQNHFFLPSQFPSKNTFQQEVPFMTSSTLTRQLLADTLRREVVLQSSPLVHDYQTISFQPVDTVYRRMLFESDNFLAEQLLLIAGSTTGTIGDTPTTIEHLLRGPLRGLPDRPRWVDGSGLSRYNLQTPRNLLFLLQRLQDVVSEETLFSFLPQIGKSGENKARIYGKSGSMSGVYNLAGFIRTSDGRLLRFAVFTNQFIHPVSLVRAEIIKILQLIQ